MPQDRLEFNVFTPPPPYVPPAPVSLTPNLFHTGSKLFEATLEGDVIAQAFVDGQLQRDEHGWYYGFNDSGNAYLGDKYNRVLWAGTTHELVGGVAFALAKRGELEEEPKPTRELFDYTTLRIGILLGRAQKSEVRETRVQYLEMAVPSRRSGLLKNRLRRHTK